MKYLAKVEKILNLEFEFTDDDIEDADSPEDAAEQLSLNYPESVWDQVDFYLEVIPDES